MAYQLSSVSTNGTRTDDYKEDFKESSFDVSQICERLFADDLTKKEFNRIVKVYDSRRADPAVQEIIEMIIQHRFFKEWPQKKATPKPPEANPDYLPPLPPASRHWEEDNGFTIVDFDPNTVNQNNFVQNGLSLLDDSQLDTATYNTLVEEFLEFRASGTNLFIVSRERFLIGFLSDMHAEKLSQLQPKLFEALMIAAREAIFSLQKKNQDLLLTLVLARCLQKKDLILALINYDPTQISRFKAHHWDLIQQALGDDHPLVQQLSTQPSSSDLETEFYSSLIALQEGRGSRKNLLEKVLNPNLPAHFIQGLTGADFYKLVHMFMLCISNPKEWTPKKGIIKEKQEFLYLLAKAASLRGATSVRWVFEESYLTTLLSPASISALLSAAAEEDVARIRDYDPRLTPSYSFSCEATANPRSLWEPLLGEMRANKMTEAHTLSLHKIIEKFNTPKTKPETLEAFFEGFFFLAKHKPSDSFIVQILALFFSNKVAKWARKTSSSLFLLAIFHLLNNFERFPMAGSQILVFASKRCLERQDAKACRLLVNFEAVREKLSPDQLTAMSEIALAYEEEDRFATPPIDQGLKKLTPDVIGRVLTRTAPSNHAYWSTYLGFVTDYIELVNQNLVPLETQPTILKTLLSDSFNHWFYILKASDRRSLAENGVAICASNEGERPNLIPLLRQRCKGVIGLEDILSDLATLSGE